MALKGPGAHMGSKHYFLGSDLLTDPQKGVLEKKFVDIRKEKMPEVENMVKSEWSMIYSQKKPDEMGGLTYHHYSWPPTGFKDMCVACEDKSQLMILIKGKMSQYSQNTTTQIQGEFTIGAFCDSLFPAEMSTNWQHEFDYVIPFSQNNFGFIYFDGKQAFFEGKYDKAFGYLYTDHEYGGALNILSDYVMVSWS
mmetsp:Transcript_13543/g.21107  ORF Transcript_13543/g.21107 Transcript_13543/m.21107 type:complete len:195 (-) Transcript_13543:6107-6691(-)